MQAFAAVLQAPTEAVLQAPTTAVVRPPTQAMTAAARTVSVRIPDTNRPPPLRLADTARLSEEPDSARQTSDRQANTVLKPVAAESTTGQARQQTATRSSGQAPIQRSSQPAAAGPVSLLARAQLADAHRGLDLSMRSQDIADRYAAAHLGALRGAAALLATRPKPASRSLKHASVWVLMAKVAPELEDWANYFAAGSAKRKAAEAGISRLISDQDATEMVRQTADFLEIVEQLIQR